MEYMSIFNEMNVARLVTVRTILGPLRKFFTSVTRSVVRPFEFFPKVTFGPIRSSSSHQKIEGA